MNKTMQVNQIKPKPQVYLVTQFPIEILINWYLYTCVKDNIFNKRILQNKSFPPIYKQIFIFYFFPKTSLLFFPKQVF